MLMKTPLGRVRGYGSAREGTGHFWGQRLSAIANIVLITAFVILLIDLHDETYLDLRAAFANPLIGLIVGLAVISFTYHMRLGLQVVVEDYVHGASKLPLLILNTFFSVAVAVACLFAIVKLSFGA
ncbi:succinate dehydrogenase, hydrophobic membrane anchor protein [Mangrovibrevibacter kandeliae]|uniref:succinate dehydrogenase, hydrophobic membrane anchor protein n=1 Tax=Mangrovibrevibacter kandeliae TaxID=2968473 RepID=UPI002118B495|nr:MULTISPECIES: succinate dehydrogenase, hydrophobic membrane anchor protein [unclassified Aurantimonas]MCQ8783020.1 succinate dehydrogenase, hydrophobic membrane anchor protein [Aurantimonas sp. CSK15Z-1]MCW4115788.1 succinate dehydrogenase, hydrophobic membrane anchor protein [Aurantimonas sp. MSK8Z-1]